MAKIHIKDLVLDVADGCPVKDVGATIAKAAEQVTLDASFINLIKVNLGNATKEQVKTVLSQIAEILSELGLHNCMLVPILTYGIQDITIEKLEIDRHE